MKVTIHKILLLLLGCISPATAKAQEAYQQYMSSAGVGANIFRATLAQRSITHCEGCAYAYDDTFHLGSMTFDDVNYSDILMNYNAYSDRLHIKRNAQMPALEIDAAALTSFSYNGHEFVNLPSLTGIAEGWYFYELIAGSGLGQAMYKKIERKLYAKTETGSPTVKYVYNGTVGYFWAENGSLFRIRSPRAIIRLVPEKKKEIKAALRQNYELDRNQRMELAAKIALQ